MKTRSEKIDDFLAESGWQGAERTVLAGDASFRRYERITHGARRAVLMDAPPPQEDVRPFIRIAEMLHATGFSAPCIFGRDVERGFLLLEDLGDDLYSRSLQRSPAMEEELYLAAADVLVQLYHQAQTADYTALPAYDNALLMRECMLLAEWFLPAVMGAEKAAPLAEEYRALWQKLLTHIPQGRKVLVQRDYHADNLLWLPQRSGVARVGLLDFQDAVVGLPAYDVVSYLEDARRDVARETVQHVLDYYLTQTAQDRTAFMESYALLGAQRNCKIVGIFARLAIRDGKQGYLRFLPRMWAHLERDLAHPLLGELRQWMDRNIKPQWRGEIAVGQAA